MTSYQDSDIHDEYLAFGSLEMNVYCVTRSNLFKWEERDVYFPLFFHEGIFIPPKPRNLETKVSSFHPLAKIIWYACHV